MCPESVRLAFSFAAASPRVSARVVGTFEFPEERRKYKVSVVPKIWINDRVFINGGLPEKFLCQGIAQALDLSVPPGPLKIK